VRDEAYGDFCDPPQDLRLLHEPDGDRVVVTRTLSKSYSLAGIRFGFAIAHPDLIRAMRKVKDSYNCDMLSLAAAAAALDDQDWMHQNADRIRRTRERLASALRNLQFDVVDSQANFVWTTRPGGGHEDLFHELKRRRILIRYMQFPQAIDGGRTVDGLRITVGTDDEIDGLLAALRDILDTAD
jgi:histidinol-phosphate aminotransferase